MSSPAPPDRSPERSSRRAPERSPERSPDPLDTAVRFAAEQPGWADRVLHQHKNDGDGCCTGCGDYRLVRWPCVLVHIATRVRAIDRR